MKTTLGAIAFFLILCSVSAQNLKVEKISPEKQEHLGPPIDRDISQKASFYKIVFKSDDSDLGLISYPLMDGTILKIDTVLLIEELLRYEGDKRLCILPIRSWDPLISQLYTGHQKRYSLQVEALFLINQLYFKKPFSYSPYPVLCDKQGHIASIDGALISSAYKSYKAWYKKVKSLGLSLSQHKGINPLDGSRVRWYR